ncbi:MAG: ABC-F family ATP-binding cassette domain-containing protein [Deltaproteobacteria bacterium]|jgi:ATP-binding cassette subfamily F protein 3|nr:ABC-F family ATP-binding cassette domain-containing protein [Deltaproteobacteria bacterium]
MSLVSFSDVCRFHNRQDVLKGVTLSIEPGERIGLVGRNGAGKTTIIRLIMDEEAPDSGQVSKARGLKLGYLPQDVMAQANLPLLTLVMDTNPEYNKIELELLDIEGEMARPDVTDEARLMELADRHGHLLTRFEALGGWAREAEAKKVLSGLGFAETDFSRNLDEFSGGWVMRAVLARLLVAGPDLLVLDEPTNHLDIDSLIWLEGYLKGSPSALLLVSHDRVFLNNVAQKIVELRQGRADVYPGNYDQYLGEKAKRLAAETAAFTNQQERIKQIEKFIERNKARASSARRAQSRVKTLERMDRLAQPDDGLEATFNLNMPRGRRGPDMVAELKHVAKSYGRSPVYRDLNLTLLRGDRLALVGPNGRGKSTLVKILAGLIDPTSGNRRLGQNVDVGYFSQFQMEDLNPGLNLLEELAKVAGHLTQGVLRTILGGFLFSGDDVFKKVSVLSGGEKTRLVLCKIMMTAPNLLIMDEPTNHLDIPGRQMLEDALDDYEGTMVLISHDRHFVNRLCDKIGVVEDGMLTVHPGNFDDYQRLWLKDPSSISGQSSPSPLGPIGPGQAPPPEQTPEKSKPAPDDAGRNDKATPPPGAARGKNQERAPAQFGQKSKADKQVDKKTAAEARKQESAKRRGLEKTLRETEERLDQVAGRSAELEAELGEPATYQDADKARTLAAELGSLAEEKAGLEKIWEETAARLDG